MAIQTILGGLVVPGVLNFDQGAPGMNFVVLDAADEKAGCVVAIAKAGTISKIVWATRTVTTGATLDVRLETVDAATGSPSGTLWGTTTNASRVLADADDNTIITDTLTAGAVVAVGDVVAVVISNPAASFGNFQVAAMNKDTSGGRPIVPYSLLFSAGAWGKSVTVGPLMIAFEYSDGSYVPLAGIHCPASAMTSTAISTASTPDVAGLRFQTAYPLRASGAIGLIDGDGDFIIRLVTTAYHQVNGTGILASTPTIDKDIRQANVAGLYYYPFTATADLSPNTNYRLVIEPTTATALNIFDFTTGSLALMNASLGGEKFHFTTAKDPTGDGDWTNHNSSTFRVPYLWLRVDGVSDGVGGGGGIIGA